LPHTLSSWYIKISGHLHSTYHYTTDVLIAGAGPAGAGTSIFLSKEKINHIIIDKAVFPRDKICGDAMSGKTVGMLQKMAPHWQEHFLADKNKSIISTGIQFIGSNKTCLDIPFQLKNSNSGTPPGFVCRRIDFDNNLLNLAHSPYANFLAGTCIEDIEYTDDGLLVKVKQQGQQKIIFTKMIVGAEGRGSLVAKKLAQHKVEAKHNSAGIRAYYTNITGMHTSNYIELYFLKEMQPGYFWIFPLPNGTANVGMGMLSSAVSAKKANLKQLMQDVIEKHPVIKERFAHASLQGKTEGWGLPLGSKKRTLSGHRFLLTGDAASLIDPFTGEGIGNAMVSALVASRQIKMALDKNNFSAAFLKGYDSELYKKLWPELKLSHYLQQLSSKPWLFNFVIGKASRSRELRETISCMFENVDIRKKFTSPLFYLKILFNR
jgi:menaquinone-9 beta-reductase